MHVHLHKTCQCIKHAMSTVVNRWKQTCGLSLNSKKSLNTWSHGGFNSPVVVLLLAIKTRQHMGLHKRRVYHDNYASVRVQICAMFDCLISASFISGREG